MCIRDRYGGYWPMEMAAEVSERVPWILDQCTDEIRAANMRDHPILATHPPQSSDMIQAAQVMMQHSHAQGGELPHARELLGMCRDAIAQVQLRTGILIWHNQSFQELAAIVGQGNPLVGQQLLIGRFLQQLPVQLHYTQAMLSAGGQQINMISATRRVGVEPNETVLWVLHSQPTPELSGTQAPLTVHTVDPEAIKALSVTQALPGESQDQSDLEFPLAGAFVDVDMKMVCDKQYLGRGKRQVVMLWRKYGEKRVLTSRSGTDRQSADGIDRLYFKCTQPDCPARLKIDVVTITSERVREYPKGRHNHRVQVAGV
eukprot:TRINITY_DN10508_c0_g1_i1.p1 TRINITY_DN10508_c0_g1~~TRINITY_DN10508_c0_g1_i1.p1  ORF type:complete len:316 (-),score=57.23 TRINITY_DN10508_c0_g1_i1:379-1326(-)